MNEFISAIVHHGYIAVIAVVFAEAIGFPMPAALALVAGGAAAASGVLRLPVLFLGSLAAMLTGDVILFITGRYTGWALLGYLCRVALNPETCILRSAESFYKRGKATLVIAKFLPGVNTMAPPLAGTMKMRVFQFLRLDFAGAVLYVSAYLGLGFVFHGLLADIIRGFQTAGHALEVIFLVALAGYVAYRIWLYRSHAMYRVVPRVQVQELVEKLAAAEHDRILLVDVRSHGYYDSGASRIKGSIRLEPNNLAEEIKGLPHDKEIYLYCT
jgi:membrane protein DedA with SNARE-associated domain